MTLLRHPEDRIPVAFFLLFFAADWTVYCTATNRWVPLVWFALCVVPKLCIGAWSHHHQHLPMFRHSLANRLLELGFALQTGIVSNGWTLHHVLGHHVNYLTPLADELRWMKPDGGTMGPAEYTWRNTIAAYPRAWKVGARYPRHRRLFFAAVGWTLAVVILAVVHNPWNGLFVFVLPMTVSLFLTVRVTWDHHADLDTRNPMEASRNRLNSLHT
jgi:hypothetical protein